MPVAKPILVPRRLVRMAIEALEYQAHMEAGQTFVPNLIKPQDTVEWAAARELEQLLRTKPSQSTS